jgi:hypothetical protein
MMMMMMPMNTGFILQCKQSPSFSLCYHMKATAIVLQEVAAPSRFIIQVCRPLSIRYPDRWAGRSGVIQPNNLPCRQLKISHN